MGAAKTPRAKRVVLHREATGGRPLFHFSSPNYTTKNDICQTDFGVFSGKKVFHTHFLSMCKTVENSVDYAENLYFRPIFRHFSPFYAKRLWKTLAQGSLFAPFFFSFFL